MSTFEFRRVCFHGERRDSTEHKNPLFFPAYGNDYYFSENFFLTLAVPSRLHRFKDV